MIKFLCAIILAACTISTSALANNATQNEGSVERRYCTQFGPFILRFDPDKAAGIFAILPNNDLGSIVGALNERELTGEWIEVDSRGEIRIQFADDWSSFSAEYNVASNPENWHSGWIGNIAPEATTTKFTVDDMTFYCH